MGHHFQESGYLKKSPADLKKRMPKLNVWDIDCLMLYMHAHLSNKNLYLECNSIIYYLFFEFSSFCSKDTY